MKTSEKIQQQINENIVIIYMKGIPEKPECGFSAKAASYLQKTGVAFAYVNILQSPAIMQGLPEFSSFPTFPQVFIKGELIGGSDIVEEMFNSGELQKLVGAITD